MTVFSSASFRLHSAEPVTQVPWPKNRRASAAVESANELEIHLDDLLDAVWNITFTVLSSHECDNEAYRKVIKIDVSVSKLFFFGVKTANRHRCPTEMLACAGEW